MIATKRKQTDGPREKILYVVFHGEIILIDDKKSDHIVAIAPRVRRHIYQAGPWLGELRIEPGAKLCLGGVQTGKKCIFDIGDRMLLIDQVPGVAETKAYFSVRLPRPDDVLPGLVLGLERGTFGEVSPPSASIKHSPGKDYPAALDAHPVFRYTVTAGKEPAIYDACGYGKDPLFKAGVGQPNYFSLHISAEEDRAPRNDEEATSHAQEAFTAVKEILGIKTEFTPKGQGGASSPILIPGLDPAEYTMPMSTRTELLRQIGEQQRFGASPDLAAVFREKWTLSGGYLPPEPTHWFPEGTCGSTGARPAGDQTTMEFLRKIGVYDGTENPNCS